ncbi:hypothetical protein DB88DRAFT_484264 [Papiliotrema laurentii]|uniref:Transmembrane protein 135 N-terminal domain-containing protein n=1 Tax=Papiliotrema laurentii TaxID=5418 RepID=A0AAD9FSX7_PAPLA|nr:hypothetical protein DB88DRAFT_484264 [Papiliotrema laurentii]
MSPQASSPSSSPPSPDRPRTAPPLPNHFASVPPPSVPPVSPSPPASPRLPKDSLSAPSSGNVSPITPAPALRRTSSSNSAEGLAPGPKEKKRLRFTPLVQLGPGGLGLTVGDDLFYPGSASRLEEGRHPKRRIPRDQADYLTSAPGTPNIQETADQIRRTLSLASVDALLLISTDSSQRDRVLADVGRAGRDFVWRDDDEEKLFPKDYERALVLAAKRGIRSFILAFSVRSGINVLLLLFRSLRKKRLRLALLRHAMFGAEPFRFGAMIGSFTFLYTLTLHILRIAPPWSYFRRRYKAGIFNEPSFGPPEREGDEGERRWQAAVAGAVGSLALLWESSSRRTGVAQQMFVRGLQAAYNQYTPRYGIHIPHGAEILFGLCCGQIMFAWLLSPETIPHAYGRWILGASRVPEFAVLGNRTIVRHGYLEPQQIQRALAHKSVTPSNRKSLLTLLEAVKNGWKPPAIPCEVVHPWVDGCRETGIRRFFDVFRYMLPVYSALHLIPMLVLRRKHVQREPLRMLARSIVGITKSCSFLGAFVLIYQGLFCLRSQTLSKADLSVFWKRILSRKETFWMMGFSTCFSLLLEERKRRSELAMYVLPRALESAWSAARKRAWLPIVPFGETILGAAAMSMVMDAYKHQPDAMSGIVRRLLYQLVGPV